MRKIVTSWLETRTRPENFSRDKVKQEEDPADKLIKNIQPELSQTGCNVGRSVVHTRSEHANSG